MEASHPNHSQVLLAHLPDNGAANFFVAVKHKHVAAVQKVNDDILLVKDPHQDPEVNVVIIVTLTVKHA